ncbi:MAG: hypothetical protein LCH39_07765 [Proteobacteria bacterium]|nr:hypothetical protein [Pseudomonadota bacterium]
MAIQPIFTNAPKTKRSPDQVLHHIKRFTRTFVHEGGEEKHLNYEVSVPEHVMVMHETLLLAILRMAQTQDRGSLYERASTFLEEVEGEAIRRDVAFVETSANELLDMCGVAANKVAYDRLEQNLDDLSKVHVKLWNEDTKAASSLIGYRWDRKNKEKIRIHVCWRLAAALVVGAGKTQDFAMIQLDDRITLPTDVARSLHRFLSAHIRPGNRQRYELETLVGKCWREKAGSPSTTRWREGEVRKAVDAIDKLQEWKITRDGRWIEVERKAL